MDASRSDKIAEILLRRKPLAGKVAAAAEQTRGLALALGEFAARRDSLAESAPPELAASLREINIRVDAQ